MPSASYNTVIQSLMQPPAVCVRLLRFSSTDFRRGSKTTRAGQTSQVGCKNGALDIKESIPPLDSLGTMAD